MSQHPPRLDVSLAEVQQLLKKHQVLTTMTRRLEAGPADRRDLLATIQERQNLAELEKRLGQLHPADLAHILEVLPHDDRRLIWGHVAAAQRGDVLLEVSAPTRALLIEWLDPGSLASTLATLDADDLAYLADDLPADALAVASSRLDALQQMWLRESAAFPERSVGALMSSEFVSVRDSMPVSQVLDVLRSRETLPGHTDHLFVVDARHVLKGTIPLTALLLSSPDVPVTSILVTDGPSFTTDEDAAVAAGAFERYDLVSAPVVDERGKLVGRVTSDRILDFLRSQAERQALGRAGLSGEEDLFASIWLSARNRWPWLLMNVVTAFVASRVIGVFGSAIQNLVALATLMPIVASIGGNTGNQTVAVVIRGLALDQLPRGSTPHLLRKELTVGLLNGLLWGGLMGLGALALYRSVALASVLTLAILLNLLIAAATGVVVPLALRHAGRDPAQGASVLLTFVTDSMGFFLFLGLATAFLRS